MEDQESPDFEISVRDGKIFADRETALRYIRDLYGRQLDADTAKEYLGQWGSVTETEIGIAQAYGDGAASSQFTEWRADGTQLIVLFSYEVLFNVEDLNTSGMAKAVFAADADSSWGYHLVSLQMAEGNDADDLVMADTADTVEGVDTTESAGAIEAADAGQRSL